MRPTSFCAFTAVLVLWSMSICSGQTKPAEQPGADAMRELNKYPGLLPEFGQLFSKLQHNVQTPPSRHQSNLLSLLPESTTYYLAIPNYGESAQQVLATFREELKQSPVLRDWWHQGDMAKSGPEVESAVEKFSAISAFVGDEIVIFGDPNRQNHEFAVVAEIRKPGLREYLTQMMKGLPGKSTSDIRVMSPQELAAAKSRAKTKDDLIVLVRPDYLIATTGIEAARDVSQLLDTKKGGFATTEFGQRIAQSYRSGTTVLGAGNLHELLAHMPKASEANTKALEQSGFSNVKYLIWDNKRIADSSVSETELTFVGPRRGPASWLAEPRSLGTLDYVSPKALLVLTVALKNPAEIFDDVKELATASNPNAFATLPQMEQMMQLSLRDDLLRQLQGEVTMEVEDLREERPVWNVILRVNDADRLQKTFEKLLVQSPPREFDSGGVHYYSLMVPAKSQPLEICYAFAEGYLIIGSGRESVANAIGVHRSGQSMAKSASFLGQIPAGYPREVSALLYEDASAVAAFQLRRLLPELASAEQAPSPTVSPITYFAYGEDSAIRGVSGGGGSQLTTSLVVAAIAIPNLLRARIAANEASAASAMRTINVSQIMYAAAFPNRGFARDLVRLGPNPANPSASSAEYASYLSGSFVADCVAKTSCSKDGYVFTLLATCKTLVCRDYVVYAAPLSIQTGTKRFCSTSDGVTRVGSAGAQSPATATECRKWDPLQ
jgi:hypothetical protein